MTTKNGVAPMVLVHTADTMAVVAAVAVAEPVEIDWGGAAVAVVGGELVRERRALER